MNKVFSPGEGFPVPDGTVVHSVLEPAALSRGTGEPAEELSVAVGHLPPGTTSKIHIHPVVTQVTWVLSGELTVTMKDPAAGAPYTLEIPAEHAVLTRPGTFFQIANPTAADCRVLYIVAPAFVFATDADGEVVYNDALVLEHGWDELAAMDWTLAELAAIDAIHAARREALELLRH